ncbi:DMT family transporter [Micromonospora rhizosphaerae]|uniref:DMT family transporter n=1 Tax=Micromonospora rhizosphaerae TaxID=568872 RepID=UPI001C4082EA|nr:DMT family transporter [Micromonospora rhizosphaerae]
MTLTLWASAFVAIRVALPGFGVAGLSVGRLVVASLMLAVIAPLLGVRRPARSDLARIVGCGLTGMTAYQILLNAGERSVPAGTASLLVNTAPIVASVLAVILLRERLPRRTVVGLALGFTGAAVIALAEGAGFTPTKDALLVLGAAVAQASFFVLQKPLLVRYRGLEVTCYVVWSGTALSLPLAPALVRQASQASGDAVIALLFLGIAPSALGFVTWAYAQARLSVAAAATSLYLVPVLAIGIGFVILGENISPAALLGGAVVLVGAAISRRKGTVAAVGTDAGPGPQTPSASLARPARQVTDVAHSQH